MEERDIQELFEATLSDKWGYKSLKKEQLQLVQAVLSKRKVSFGILPTGFGKSDVYAIPPLLLDQIDPENAPHVALVISPLRSLMIDQVKRWRDIGVSCAAIFQKKEMEPEDIQAIMRAEPSIVFTSPEAIMAEPWRSMMHLDCWVQHLCMVCCDEAHCIHDWGLDFRPAYKQVVELRGVMDVPWVFLTATCSTEMMEAIQKVIGSPKEPNIVAVLPDRPNIYLDFVPKPGNLHKELMSVVDNLRDDTSQMAKTIIYCASAEDVCDIWDSFYQQLGNDIFISGKDREAFGGMLVAQYHRGIGKAMEHSIVAEFAKPDSAIRILISTVAFGMGVQVPDIRRIIHWGLSSTIAAYWQEVGRGGRDGQPASATLYAVRIDKRYSSKEFCDLANELRIADSDNTCMRKPFIKHFILPESDLVSLESLDNRSHCTNDCTDCAAFAGHRVCAGRLTRTYMLDSIYIVC